MSVRIAALLAFALSACATAASPPSITNPEAGRQAWAAACKDFDEWDKAGPPFRIHGNTYYVGTCGISAILVTGKSGHLLIDTGTESGADGVLANIRSLGLEPRDIRALLVSHEHFDHVGGLAKIEQATGGRIVFSELGSHVLTYGDAVKSYGAYGTPEFPIDPQADTLEPMRRVAASTPYTSGQAKTLLREFGITGLPTPGHTPGAMSWQWQSCQDEACLTIVYADSLSPISSDSYRFSDHPEYLRSYRQSLARIAALECDILLTPHPSSSGMRDKLLAGKLAGGINCRQYAEALGKRLDERLAKEAAGG